VAALAGNARLITITRGLYQCETRHGAGAPRFLLRL
jgi:hypothetical protein